MLSQLQSPSGRNKLRVKRIVNSTCQQHIYDYITGVPTSGTVQTKSKLTFLLHFYCTLITTLSHFNQSVALLWRCTNITLLWHFYCIILAHYFYIKIVSHFYHINVNLVFIRTVRHQMTAVPSVSPGNTRTCRLPHMTMFLLQYLYRVGLYD